MVGLPEHCLCACECFVAGWEHCGWPIGIEWSGGVMVGGAGWGTGRGLNSTLPLLNSLLS